MCRRFHWRRENIVPAPLLGTPGDFGAERALGSRYFDHEASGHVERQASRARLS
jgi:hypothetical protein